MFAHFTQETGGHNPNGEVEEWRQGLVYLRYVSWPLIGQTVSISDWSISGRLDARRQGLGVSTAARVTQSRGKAGPGHAAKMGDHGRSIMAGELNNCPTTSTTAPSLTPCSGQ